MGSIIAIGHNAPSFPIRHLCSHSRGLTDKAPWHSRYQHVLTDVVMAISTAHLSFQHLDCSQNCVHQSLGALHRTTQSHNFERNAD